MAYRQESILKEMRKYNIKDLSDYEIKRICEKSISQDYCLSVIKDMIKSGLTIEEVYGRNG